MKKDLQPLKLFCQKTNELLSSSFYTSLVYEKNRIIFVSNHGNTETVAIRPTDEELNAFLLTYRYFIQDKGLTSIRNTFDQLKASGVLEQTITEFVSLQDKFNDFLKQKTYIKFKQGIDLISPTHREILDIFIYGHYAHAEPDKQIIYQSWTSDRISKAAFENEFNFSLKTVGHFINEMRSLVINHLKTL